MPTAPQHLTDQFESDGHATIYLQKRGFKLQRDWTWLPPSDYKNMEFCQKDWDAIDYLIFEWDFGGLSIEN